MLVNYSKAGDKLDDFTEFLPFSDSNNKDSTEWICTTQESCSLVFGNGSFFLDPLIFDLWRRPHSVPFHTLRVNQGLGGEVRDDLTHLGS